MKCVELTNMVMVTDPETGLILAQRRVADWAGLSFPGGHVEDGESLVDSAVREVLEETGLAVRNLRGCGVVHWTHLGTHDRYLAFLYRTSDFSGKLLPATREGENLWMTREELAAAPTDNGTPDILRLFLHDEYSEAFGCWGDGEPWRIVAYK